MCILCTEIMKEMNPIERVEAGKEILSTTPKSELTHVLEKLLELIEEAKCYVKK